MRRLTEMAKPALKETGLESDPIKMVRAALLRGQKVRRVTGFQERVACCDKKQWFKNKPGDVATLVLSVTAIALRESCRRPELLKSCRKDLLQQWELQIWGSSLDQRPGRRALRAWVKHILKIDAAPLETIKCFAIIRILFGGFVPCYASRVSDVVVIRNKFRLAFWPSPFSFLDRPSCSVFVHFFTFQLHLVHKCDEDRVASVTGAAR